MKRALLLCIVGLLCMGAIPYSAVGWDFPGNATVQDNVGIGTESPTARLDIHANPNPAALTGTVSVTTGGITVLGSGTHFTTQLAVGNVVTIDNGTYTVTTIASDILIFIDPLYQGVTASGINMYLGAVTIPPLLTIFDTTSNGAVSKVTVTDIGYVGIGTKNPQAKLEVAGNMKAANLTVTGPIWGNDTLRIDKSILMSRPLPGKSNKALCWHSSGLIGYCTTAVDASGGCTCTVIQ